MFLWYRLVAVLSSQFILKLSQLVLHISDPCLCVLPVHTQLSQPARNREHTNVCMDTALNDINSHDYSTLLCLVNKLQYVLVWWNCEECVLEKVGLSHSWPLTDNGTMPLPAFPQRGCVCVCKLSCPHSDCVSFNSFFFRSSISWSCRFSSRQDSSSAFRAGSELLTES